MALPFSDVKYGCYAKLLIKYGPFNILSRRWLILRRESSKGPKRLDIYSSYKNARKSPLKSKSIRLTDIKDVEIDKTGFKILIYFSDKSIFEFYGEDTNEVNLWKENLLEIKKDTLFSNEDGSIYKSAYLLPNAFIEYYGECLLGINAEHLIVKNGSNNTILIEWKLKNMRRLNCHGEEITIETGRRSSTGEGLFLFNCPKAKEIQDIFNQVVQKLKPQ